MQMLQSDWLNYHRLSAIRSHLTVLYWKSTSLVGSLVLFYETNYTIRSRLLRAMAPDDGLLGCIPLTIPSKKACIGLVRSVIVNWCTVVEVAHKNSGDIFSLPRCFQRKYGNITDSIIQFSRTREKKLNS